MTRDTASRTPSDGWETAASRPWQNDRGCVPVVDESGHVHGAIADCPIRATTLACGGRSAEPVGGDPTARDVTGVESADSLQAAAMLVLRSGAFAVLP